jgi:hypothetical protein
MIPTFTAALSRIGEDGAPGFGGWGMVVFSLMTFASCPS